MGKILGSLLGTNVKAPTVSTAPQVEVEEDQKKNKKRSSALYVTEGGASGSELGQGQVGGRGNIFGN